MYSVPEDCFIIANSADPGEMPPYAIFMQYFIWVFTACQSYGIQNENGHSRRYAAQLTGKKKFSIYNP